VKRNTNIEFRIRASSHSLSLSLSLSAPKHTHTHTHTHTQKHTSTTCPPVTYLVPFCAKSRGCALIPTKNVMRPSKKTDCLGAVNQHVEIAPKAYFVFLFSVLAVFVFLPLLRAGLGLNFKSRARKSRVFYECRSSEELWPRYCKFHAL
jgi:hypothetical protein